MNYGAQAFEIRRVENLLTVALGTIREGPGTVADQRAYEQARKAGPVRDWCPVRYGLPYVAPIWPARRIAS